VLGCFAVFVADETKHEYCRCVSNIRANTNDVSADITYFPYVCPLPDTSICTAINLINQLSKQYVYFSLKTHITQKGNKDRSNSIK